MTSADAIIGTYTVERISIDELRAVQLERLQWILRHAYEHIPFYRKKFDEAGVAP